MLLVMLTDTKNGLPNASGGSSIQTLSSFCQVVKKPVVAVAPAMTVANGRGGGGEPGGVAAVGVPRAAVPVALPGNEAVAVPVLGPEAAVGAGPAGAEVAAAAGCAAGGVAGALSEAQALSHSVRDTRASLGSAWVMPEMEKLPKPNAATNRAAKGWSLSLSGG